MDTGTHRRHRGRAGRSHGPYRAIVETSNVYDSAGSHMASEHSSGDPGYMPRAGPTRPALVALWTVCPVYCAGTTSCAPLFSSTWRLYAPWPLQCAE